HHSSRRRCISPCSCLHCDLPAYRCVVLRRCRVTSSGAGTTETKTICTLLNSRACADRAGFDGLRFRGAAEDRTRVAQRFQRGLLRAQYPADVDSCGSPPPAFPKAASVAHTRDAAAGGSDSSIAVMPIPGGSCSFVWRIADHCASRWSWPWYTSWAFPPHRLHRGLAANPNLALGEKLDPQALQVGDRRDDGGFGRANLLRRQVFVLFETGSHRAYLPARS